MDLWCGLATTGGESENVRLVQIIIARIMGIPLPCLKDWNAHRLQS